MIEAMKWGLAWEYEYYETCNIAEALQQSDSFDVIHFHVGCPYAVPLEPFLECQFFTHFHNPITRDAIWLLNRYATLQSRLSADARLQEFRKPTTRDSRDL